MRYLKNWALLAWITMLAGCNSAGTPTFVLGDREGKQSGPKVRVMIDEAACELAAAMNLHLGDPLGRVPSDQEWHATDTAMTAFLDSQQQKFLAAAGGSMQSPMLADFKLWRNLIDDNFVATVNMSLQVTNSEGLNPSLNFITPYAPVTVPGGGSPFNGNFTLAVNGQFDGTQNRTFTLTYLIDLSRLYAHQPDRAVCDENKRELLGRFGLDEIFGNGLSSIDETARYDIYSTPTSSQAGAVPERSSSALSFGGPSAQGASKTNTVSFFTEIDFTVVEALSGGPSWSLRHFSGPGGGGGGGGGKGGGGSGSGSSGTGGGGGGGASQGLLATNRTVVDSVSIQAGATCRKSDSNDSNYWVAIDKCTDKSGATTGSATASVLQLQNQLNLNLLKGALQ